MNTTINLLFIIKQYIMATKESKMEDYAAQLKEIGENVDMVLLKEITDGLGPANFNADASLVSCSDDKELERVYTNFVADELAVSDKEQGMKAIEEVCGMMKGINRKHRGVFYYLLAKKFK
jgi:hypothetical protein